MGRSVRSVRGVKILFFQKWVKEVGVQGSMALNKNKLLGIMEGRDKVTEDHINILLRSLSQGL